MDKVCAQHHKMLEKVTFFQVLALTITLASLACGAVVVTSASVDQVNSVQKQVDTQRDEMKELRREMNQRFDRIDRKLDALNGIGAKNAGGLGAPIVSARTEEGASREAP